MWKCRNDAALPGPQKNVKKDRIRRRIGESWAKPDAELCHRAFPRNTIEQWRVQLEALAVGLPFYILPIVS